MEALSLPFALLACAVIFAPEYLDRPDARCYVAKIIGCFILVGLLCVASVSLLSLGGPI